MKVGYNLDLYVYEQEFIWTINLQDYFQWIWEGFFHRTILNSYLFSKAGRVSSKTSSGTDSDFKTG